MLRPLDLTVWGEMMQQVYTRFFLSSGKTRDGISRKVLEDVIFPIIASCSFYKGAIWKVFGGVSLGGNVSYRFIERIINHMQCTATFFFFGSIGSVKNLERSSTRVGSGDGGRGSPPMICIYANKHMIY